MFIGFWCRHPVSDGDGESIERRALVREMPFRVPDSCHRGVSDFLTKRCCDLGAGAVSTHLVGKTGSARPLWSGNSLGDSGHPLEMHRTDPISILAAAERLGSFDFCSDLDSDRRIWRGLSTVNAPAKRSSDMRGVCQYSFAQSADQHKH